MRASTDRSQAGLGAAAALPPSAPGRGGRRWPGWLSRAGLARQPAWLLFSANLAAQGLGLLLAPALARLYAPAAFGVLGALSSLVLILSPLMTGRYEMALAHVSSERQAYDLLRLCWRWIAGMALLVTVLGALLVLGPTGHWLAATGITAPGLGLLRASWWALPVALVAVAMYDTLAMEASRRQAFMPLAASKLTQAGLGQGSQLLMGWLAWGTPGLVLGYLVNQGAGVWRLVAALWREHPGRLAPAGQPLSALAWRLRRNPLWASWAASLDALGRWVPQLALSVAWDAQVGGFVFLAERLVGRPLLMMSTAMLPVYMARLQQARLPGADLSPLRLYGRTVLQQVLLSAAWTAAVVWASPGWTLGLLGPSWAAAWPYVQAVAVMLAPVAALHAVSHTLELVGCQMLQSALVLLRVSAVLLLLGVCHRSDSSALAALHALAALNLALALVTALAQAWALRQLATGGAQAKS